VKKKQTPRHPQLQASKDPVEFLVGGPLVFKPNVNEKTEGGRRKAPIRSGGEKGRGGKIS